MLDLQRRRRTLLSLNARQIGELVRELAPLLEGLVLRDVAPLPPRDLLFVFEVTPEGPVRRLLVSCDVDASRLHLVQERLSHCKHPLGPFYAQITKELVGAQLKKIEQVASDRIVWLEFRTADEERRFLCGELTGRHANLVLLDPRETVLCALVPPPKNVRGAPRLEPGKPWRGPGGTPPSHAELAGIEDEYPDPEGHSAEKLAPLSHRVEANLGGEVKERREGNLRSQLMQRLKRKEKRLRSKLAGLEKRLAAVEGAESIQQEGELLKANLQSVKRGAKTIVVQDWFAPDAGERTIELDPKLAPAENVEKIFARYRKLLRSADSLPEEMAEAEGRLARLEEFRTRAKTEDPEALDDEAIAAGLLDPRQIADPRKKKAPAPRLPYKIFRSARGSEIRVGKSARDNDLLSTRHCRGKDLWLHTADAPGSHVVLCLEGRAEAEEEELLDALHLAAHFSPLKNAPRVNVHVARGNQVKKPRGAKPGLVQLSGGRIVLVRMQPERLRGLLAQGRPPTSAGPDR